MLGAMKDVPRLVLSKGFTIIEVIVVIGIIGILAAVAIVGYGSWQSNLNENVVKSDLNGVAGAMESARNFGDSYPASVPADYTPSDGVFLAGGSVDAGNGYCVSATKATKTFFISQFEIALPGTCPRYYYDVNVAAGYPGGGRSVKNLSGYDDGTLTLREGTDNTTGGPSYTTAELGGALRFDGVNDKLYNQSQITYGANTSWAACAKLVASGNVYNMFMGNFLPYFGVYNGNSIIFSASISGTQRSVVAPPNIVSVNQWNCYVFTTSYDGTNTVMTVYLNGSQVAATTFAGQLSNPSSIYRFTIGDGRHDLGVGYWYPFNGFVSDVAVYDSTLNAGQVRNLFEALRTKYNI